MQEQQHIDSEITDKMLSNIEAFMAQSWPKPVSQTCQRCSKQFPFVILGSCAECFIEHGSHATTDKECAGVVA